MTKSILKILGITLCTATIINSNQILMADVLNSTDEKISIETNETLNMDYFFDNICEKSTDENGNTIYKYSIKQYEDYMNSISNSEELFNTLNLSSDSLIFNTWQSNYNCFGDSLKSFSKEIYDIYKDKLKI